MDTPALERHLLTIREGHSETTYVLDASAYSIGRDPNCAIVLATKSISRRHAILLRTPTPQGGYRYRIIDGDAQGRPSANGIQVNRRACKEKQLEHNDQIVFGIDEVQAQYRVEVTSEVLSGKGVRVAEFRSLKKQDNDSLPTIAGDNVIFESGVITYIHPDTDEGYITVELEQGERVNASIHMAQVLATLRLGDRVNVTRFEGQYMFLGKLDPLASTPAPDHTVPKTIARPPLPGNLTPPAHKPKVLDPPLVPTLQGQSSAIPPALKNLVEQRVKLYRRCYEAVVREMGDLQLREDHYITIAGQILVSLQNPDGDGVEPE